MTFTKLPKAITAEELLSTPLPPVKWIIPGLLPAGLALFAGPSKAGKSWLTLWLCLQVAQGKPVWGREVEPRTVLYLSLEDTLNRLQERLFRLVGSEDTPERLILQTECQSIGQGLEEQITSFLYNHSDTGLVVIDTLQKVRSCDQSGSMYASDYKDVSTLKALADKYGDSFLSQLSVCFVVPQVNKITLRSVQNMASIRKRGSNSYLIVVSRGYDYEGNRLKSVQKTVKPPKEYTPKQAEKWVKEQAILFEREVQHTPEPVNHSITLAKYIEHWAADIGPKKLADSTFRRDEQDIRRILPTLGNYKLTDLRKEVIRDFYEQMRHSPRLDGRGNLSEKSVEGLHNTLCGILSAAVDEGYLTHNPAWRCYKPKGKKKERLVADEETVKKLITAFEGQSMKYETYFKLVLATGLRRGEACGLKWSDINWRKRTIHVQRGVVKLSHQESITKDPKTSSGDRMVYLSKEMCQLLKAWRKECEWDRQQTANETVDEDDYLFRQPNGKPMCPSTFTYRFKLILKANNLPLDLNVHSLRHTNASLLIAQGVDVRTVASLLGHAQASTTLDIYAHAFDKNKRKAQEKLGKAIGL